MTPVLSDSAIQPGRPWLDRLQRSLRSTDRAHAEMPLAGLGLPAMLLLSMAAGSYFAQAFLAIVAGRHLYGDGSWYLVRLLTENHVTLLNAHGWHDFFVERYGAFAFQEYPTLLAVRLHVRNPQVLSLVYGATLFSFKPLSILLCYRFARDKRLVIIPLLSLFAVTMNSEVYIVTETHLMTALFWPALFGIVGCRELKSWDLAAMVLVSAPLLLCYEVMVLYGLFLCAACIYRYLAIAESRRESWLSWIFFAWYGAAVFLAGLAILFPRDTAQRDGFLRGLLFIFRNDHIGARVSCFVLVICGLIVLVPERYPKAMNALTAVAVLSSAAIPLYIIRYPNLTHFGTHILARTMGGTVPLLLACAFVVIYFGPLRVGMLQFQRLFVIAAVLGICQSGWSMIATTQWSNMLTVLRAELRTHRGPVPLEQTALGQWTVDGQPMRGLHAEWPVLSLSILYSDHRTVQTILVPPAEDFRPFNPYDESSLPNLQRFGFTYAPYLAALATDREHGPDKTPSVR